MSFEDLIKLALVGPLFLLLAPAAGLALRGRPGAQRVVLALAAFMTINGFLGPGNWGLTLGSIETYRGHTKGFHFYFNQALAVALIVARWAEDGFALRFALPGVDWLGGVFRMFLRRAPRREDPNRFRWLPAGLGAYLAYCAISMLSLSAADEPRLVFMTAHKMLFAATLMLAAYNVLRTPGDLQFLLRVLALTVTWELLVVLKLKYADGMYQVKGTFEHQNPLAMYCVMLGMVFLATGLGPPFPGSGLVLWGYLASAVIVQSTLSRAALAAFAAGTVAVVGVGLAERLTRRRLLGTALLGVIGLAGLLVSLDTIVARFNDRGNTASGELREVMNTAARDMARDHWFGVGWNHFARVVNPPYPYAETYYEWIRSRGMTVDDSKPNAVVESHYYLILGENGVPALVAYLLVIAGGLWRNLRGFLAFPHSFVRCLSLGLGAGCLLNYGQSLLERVLVQPRNLMLWMLLFGVTARLETMRRAGHSDAVPGRGA